MTKIRCFRANYDIYILYNVVYILFTPLRNDRIVANVLATSFS